MFSEDKEDKRSKAKCAVHVKGVSANRYARWAPITPSNNPANGLSLYFCNS